MARPGEAWLGQAWQGKAIHGKEAYGAHNSAPFPFGKPHRGEANMQDDQDMILMLACLWHRFAEVTERDYLREDARDFAREAGVNPFIWRRFELGNLE